VVRIFVFRILPDAPLTGPPVVYLGGTLGAGFVYADVAAVALTLPGHELIGIELRGTGHSQPSLSCPEVDALSGRTRAEPIEGPEIRRAFLASVAACRDRIASSGVDLAAFHVPTMAGDVLAVVGALGLDSWEILSKGSTSRVAFEAMRAHPPGLAGVVLYNPEFPDTDPFLQSIESTRASIRRLAEACDHSPACAGWFPNVMGDMRRAIDRLQANPIRVRTDGTTVFMDGAALLRSVRARLSALGGEQLAILHLPATIATIADARDPSPALRGLASLDTGSQTYCAGYVQLCGTGPGLSQGVYYSVLCRDVVPFADPSVLPALAGGGAWSSDFVHSPYLDVCRAWDVPAASDTVTEPVSSDVPVYIDSGAFSPFVTPAVVRAAIGGLSRVSLGISPVNSDGGYFVGMPGTHCPDLRLAFLDDPTAPVDFSCYAGGRLRFVDSTI
jgi:pimeloyl-ACP methyl ester carboxylesterase